VNPMPTCLVLAHLPGFQGNDLKAARVGLFCLQAVPGLPRSQKIQPQETE